MATLIGHYENVEAAFDTALAHPSNDITLEAYSNVPISQELDLSLPVGNNVVTEIPINKDITFKGRGHTLAHAAGKILLNGVLSFDNMKYKPVRASATDPIPLRMGTGGQLDISAENCDLSNVVKGHVIEDLNVSVFSYGLTFLPFDFFTLSRSPSGVLKDKVLWHSAGDMFGLQVEFTTFALFKNKIRTDNYVWIQLDNGTVVATSRSAPYARVSGISTPVSALGYNAVDKEILYCNNTVIEPRISTNEGGAWTNYPYSIPDAEAYQADSLYYLESENAWFAHTQYTDGYGKIFKSVNKGAWVQIAMLENAAGEAPFAYDESLSKLYIATPSQVYWYNGTTFVSDGIPAHVTSSGTIISFAAGEGGYILVGHTRVLHYVNGTLSVGNPIVKGCEFHNGAFYTWTDNTYGAVGVVAPDIVVKIAVGPYSEISIQGYQASTAHATPLYGIKGLFFKEDIIT